MELSVPTDLGTVDGHHDLTVTATVRNFGWRPATVELPASCCVLPGQAVVHLAPFGSAEVPFTVAIRKAPLGSRRTDLAAAYRVGDRRGVASTTIRYEVRR